MFQFLQRRWKNLVAESKDLAKAQTQGQLGEHTWWLLVMFPFFSVALYTFGDCVVGWSLEGTRFHNILNWSLSLLGAEDYIQLMSWISLCSILVVLAIVRCLRLRSSVYLKRALDLDISPVSKDRFIRFWKRITLFNMAIELTICFLFNEWLVYVPILLFIPRQILKVITVTIYQKTLSSEPFVLCQVVIPPFSTYLRNFPEYVCFAVVFLVVPIVCLFDYFRQYLENTCANECTCTFGDVWLKE